MLYFVISVPYHDSAKLSHNFPKQHKGSQNVAELELDILGARLLEEQSALCVLSPLCQRRLSLLVYQCDFSNQVCCRWSLHVILR